MTKYQVSQQVLNRNLAEKSQNSEMAKKLVKVCLHFSEAVQISLQFDEYF